MSQADSTIRRGCDTEGRLEPETRRPARGGPPYRPKPEADLGSSSFPYSPGPLQEPFLPRTSFARDRGWLASSQAVLATAEDHVLTHIGTALHRPPPRSDRTSIRRHSYPAGRCEGVFWRRTDRQEVRRVLLAARRYELATRPPGRRAGALGHVALELLELLGNLVSYKTGRLDPAVTFLMDRLKRSRDAVVRALQALRAHGFLDWLRRYEPTECEGRGPQVRQVSNAYRMVLPPRAARLLGLQGEGAPLPDDMAHALEERRRALAALKASLPLDELARLEVEDGPLGRLLGELGRLVEERESARRTESQAKSSL